MNTGMLDLSGHGVGAERSGSEVKAFWDNTPACSLHQQAEL